MKSNVLSLVYLNLNAFMCCLCFILYGIVYYTAVHVMLCGFPEWLAKVEKYHSTVEQL